MSDNLQKVHWMKDAACKDYPTKLFTSFDPELNTQAKEICKSCKVKNPCLMDGFDTPFIRAGLTRYERLQKIWRRIDSPEESNFDY